MQNNTHRLAIIGGGTAALYLLKYFVLQAPDTHFSLSIFENGERLGVGMPYSPNWSNREHELNIASKELPDLGEEPHMWLLRQPDEVFAYWGIAREDVTPFIILPRILFGIYQEEQFYRLVSLGRCKGLDITLRNRTSVTNISNVAHLNQIRVTTADCSEYIFDQIIIATGHHWPKNLEGKIANYYDSPYPLRKLKDIKNTKIGIIGTSLSAVDAIRTLARANGRFHKIDGNKLEYLVASDCPDFSIAMHSRRGLPPSVRYHLEHPRIKRYEYISQQEIEQHITDNHGFLSLDYVFKKSYLDTIKIKDPDTYSDISQMTLEEFVEYYYQREGRDADDQFIFLENQLKINQQTEQLQTPLYWKEAIEDTVYTLNFHAKALSAEDTIRLRKYLMPLYYHAVIFMPYESTEELLALHRAGCLKIVKLGAASQVITNENEPGGMFQFINHSRETQQLVYPVLVDCRGQKQLPFEQFPFSQLIKDGTVSPAKLRFADSNNLDLEQVLPEGCDIDGSEYATSGVMYVRLPGIAITNDFQVINSNGEVNPNIYIVAGPYIKGMSPDLSGIPFCNDSAKVIMDSIFSKC